MLKGYKTYIGIVISFIGNMLSMFGVKWVSGDDLQAVANLVLELGGLILAIYGRWDVDRKPKQ